jgi:hypothetical protein
MICNLFRSLAAGALRQILRHVRGAEQRQRQFLTLPVQCQVEPEGMQGMDPHNDVGPAGT